MKIATLACKTKQQCQWREMEVSKEKKEEKERSAKKKRENEDKNKNPEGKKAKEMKSVKKGRKSAAAVLREACAPPTPQSFLTLNPFTAIGGQPLPLAL